MSSLSKKDAPRGLTEVETDVPQDGFLVSKTDLKGYITYANRIFAQACGYSIEQLLGSNHNLIRHPDMPQIAFKLLWQRIQTKSEFFGFVKNLRRDGGFYWVFAYITADINDTGDIVGYTSIRRRASREGINEVEPLYRQLCDVERSEGVAGSQKLLNNILESNRCSYDEFVMALQKGEL